MVYEMKLAFPNPSPSFVHGFVCGQLYQRMKAAAELVIEETVMAETRESIECLAMAQGWTEAFHSTLDPNWLIVRLYSPLEANAELRKPGYYWVQRRGSEHLEVLHWSGAAWWMPGSDQAQTGAELRVIGQAEPPELNAATVSP